MRPPFGRSRLTLQLHPGSFRVLCHQFRHDPAFLCALLRRHAAGRFDQPGSPPRASTGRCHQQKRNLSVYDIQRQLAETGQQVSINTLTLLLREEGFARLPRRGDDERPSAVHPEPTVAADVRLLRLGPRSFRTRVGGLFLFVPVMRDIHLEQVVQQARLPAPS